jgi:hypothetical protein
MLTTRPPKPLSATETLTKIQQAFGDKILSRTQVLQCFSVSVRDISNTTTCTVTIRRVRAIIVVMEEHKVLRILSVYLCGWA